MSITCEDAADDSDDDMPERKSLRIPPPPMQKGQMRPLRILCFDGGGVKGLNTVWSLAALEAHIGGQIPWEKYDLIAGTSVGGILATEIAAGLRTTSQSLEDLLWAMYRRLIEPVSVVDRVLRGYAISRDALLEFAELCDPKGRGYRYPFAGGLPCFVVTCRVIGDGTSEPFLVRNYAPPAGSVVEGGEVSSVASVASSGNSSMDGPASGCYGTWSMRDTKYATASAPTFAERVPRFDPENDDQAYYMDGAVYAVNPTSVAIFEAKRLWPGRPIGCVHSFGVGRLSVKSQGKDVANASGNGTPGGGGGDDPSAEGLTDLARRVVNACLDYDWEYRKACELLRLVDPDASVVRVQTPLTDVTPFDRDLGAIAQMKMDTADFLESEEALDAFEAIAADLGLHYEPSATDVVTSLQPVPAAPSPKPAPNAAGPPIRVPSPAAPAPAPTPDLPGAAPKAQGKLTAALKQKQPELELIAPRPEGAVGPFLRLVTINDVYTLDNYPKMASAVVACKEQASSLDCVVTSHLNGDFLSPCVISSLDAGKAMMQGLNEAKIDYACLGNHEFDLGFETLAHRKDEFKGKLINSNVKSECVTGLPKYHTFKVGDRTVVLTGCTSSDVSIYARSARPEIAPVTDAIKDAWSEAKKDIGTVPDLLLPMTHQTVAEDEDTAVALNAVDELKGRVPVILGGHEHDIFVREKNGTRIVKMGSDGITIGIVDVWWDKDSKVYSSCKQVPAKDFPDEPQAAEWARKQNDTLKSMLQVPITCLPEKCSSTRVRYEPSKLASFLLQKVKRGLKPDGVDMLLLQGGGIRGGRDYEAGPFTLENLYSEFPYDTGLAIVPLPGQVLVDTVREMRCKEGEKPGFVHLDLDADVSEDHELLKIDGAQVDPEKEYTIATNVLLLGGMNNVEPMYTYAKSSKMRVPDEEECKPIKQVILSVCMKDAWRQLLDIGPDGFNMTKRELQDHLARKFKECDKDGNGLLDKKEILAVMHEKKLDCGLLKHMVDALDTSGDGKISEKELQAVCQ